MSPRDNDDCDAWPMVWDLIRSWIGLSAMPGGDRPKNQCQLRLPKPYIVTVNSAYLRAKMDPVTDDLLA